MTDHTFTHFVFVDFENVPKVDLGLVAGKPVHVTLLIGKQQKKLETALSLQMHQFAAQVTPIEMGASGRDALDIALACNLGRAIERLPGAEYFIVSKDTGYDPMIGQQRAIGIKITRKDSFAELPFIGPLRKRQVSKPPFQPYTETMLKAAPAAKIVSTPGLKTATEKYAKLIAQIRSGKSRPKTRPKLMHHIHTVYGQKTTREQQIATVKKLISDLVVSIDDKDKVTYPGQA